MARGRLALAAMVVAIVGTVGAPPAAALPVSAHAGITATQPAQGSRLEVAPTAVSVRFTETVGFDSGALVVVGPDGERVDTGRAVRPDGDDHTVSVGLRRLTTTGSYLVTWRVVSADSHPGSGTFTFGYRAPAEPAPPPPQGDPWVSGWQAVLRWSALAGAVVLLGAVCFVTVLWPGGVRLRSVRRLLAGSWGLAVVGTLGSFVVAGPAGVGRSLTAVTDPSLVALTAGTGFGRLLLLRLVVLAIAAMLWRRVRQGLPPGRWDGFGLGLLTVETFSYGGHAGQGDLTPVAATVDALHLGAAAIWLGGLAVLALGLGDPEVVAALPRWSRLAATCVAVLALTGGYQAWRGVRTPAAAPATDYGRLVLLKVVLFVTLLAVALVSRRSLRPRPPGPGSPGPGSPGPGSPGRRLRHPVAGELALGAAVLVVTAGLVSTMPARLAYAPQHRSTVTATDLAAGHLLLQLQVGPTRPGFENLDLQVSDESGRSYPFVSASAVLTEAEHGLGPISVTLIPDGRGGARAEAVAVPAPGTWTLVVYVRTGPVTTYVGQDSYLVQQ